MLLCALLWCTAVAVNAQSVSNAAIENIMTRASVRKFEQREVEQEKIDILLRAGLAAPSSRDMRPWHLVVIKDKEAIEKYAANIPHHADQLKATPLIIVVCGDETRFQPDEAHDFWVEDCSAVSQNILLAAHAQGLGAVWTSVYPQMRKVNGIKRNLNLPDNLIPFSAIRIGYPAEKVDAQDKWDENKITYWK